MVGVRVGVYFHDELHFRRRRSKEEGGEGGEGGGEITRRLQADEVTTATCAEGGRRGGRYGPRGREDQAYMAAPQQSRVTYIHWQEL